MKTIKNFLKNQLFAIRYSKLSRSVWGVILAVITFIISKFFDDYTIGQNITETLGGVFLLVPLFYSMVSLFYAGKNLANDIFRKKDMK